MAAARSYRPPPPNGAWGLWCAARWIHRGIHLILTEPQVFRRRLCRGYPRSASLDDCGSRHYLVRCCEDAHGVPCRSAALILLPSAPAAALHSQSAPAGEGTATLLALSCRCCISQNSHRAMASPEKHFEISKQYRNYCVKETFLTHQRQGSAFRNAAVSKLLLNTPHAERSRATASLPSHFERLSSLARLFLPRAPYVIKEGKVCRSRDKAGCVRYQ